MAFQTRMVDAQVLAAVAPPPTTANILRHMAEAVVGTDGDSVMWRHALSSAAVELEKAQDMLRSVREWAEDTHELESYGSVRSDNGSRLITLLDGKLDAPQTAG